MVLSPRTQVLALSMAVASLSVQDVLGYAATVPYTKPVPFVFTLPDVQLDTRPSLDDPFSNTGMYQKRQAKQESTAAEVATTSPSKSTYDLGLGKNAPVPHLASTQHVTFSKGETTTKGVVPATRHWSEYEAVREYPSPQSQTTVEFEKADTDKKPRKKAFIYTTRSLQDSLTIVESDASASYLPAAAEPEQTMLPVMIQSDLSQLDVNSVWVEMLLHSLQQKHAAAN